VRAILSDAIIDRLLMLCRAADNDDFPSLYHKWEALFFSAGGEGGLCSFE
jgi:hypothetical protein